MKKRIVLMSAACFLAGMAGLSGCISAGLSSAMAYADLTKPNDPITREIRKDTAWGHATPLTPKPFAEGASEADVMAALQAAHYKTDPDKQFSFRNPKAFPVDRKYFKRDEDGPPCNIRYEVVVRFDAFHRLVEAWGTHDEAGCL